MDHWRYDTRGGSWQERRGCIKEEITLESVHLPAHYTLSLLGRSFIRAVFPSVAWRPQRDFIDLERHVERQGAGRRRTPGWPGDPPGGPSDRPEIL